MGLRRRCVDRGRGGARVSLPPFDIDGAGLVLAAAPGIADELLAALDEIDGLDPILD